MRLLPCQHSVCLDCLTKLISSSASSGTFSCPTCRSLCRAPKGGAQAIDRDMMASKLIGILASQVDRRCKNWSPENPHVRSTSYCFTCDGYLCANCHDNHRMSKELRSHHVVCTEVDEEQEKANRRQSNVVTIAKCRLHKDQVISRYCLTCQDVDCPTCIRQLHLDHTSKSITECKIEFSKKLNVLFESCISYIAHLNKLLSELGETRADIDSGSKAAVDAVKSSAEGLSRNMSKMRKTISEKQDRFVAKLKVVENDALQQVTDSEEALQEYRQHAVNLQKSIEAVRRMDQGYKRAARTLAMEEELSDLKKQEVTCIVWSASVQYQDIKADHFKSNKGKNQKVIGNISVNSAVSHDRTPERKRPVEDPLYTLPLKYEGKRAVCGFAVTDTHVYVVHSYDPHIWIYDFNEPGQDIRLKVPHMEEPAGMACLNVDPVLLVITDKKRKIHFLTLDEDQQLTNNKIVNTAYTPSSVTINSDDQLVVVSSQSDKLLILDERGKLVKEIPLTQTMFHRLRYAMAVEGGYVLVDSGKNQVFWIDEKGVVTHTYGTSKGEKMSHPTCAIQDNHGRTIITDFLNDSLHLLGPDHTRLQLLVKTRHGDAIHRPGCLHLDLKNGLLFMSHGFVGLQEIRVYSYPDHHLPLTQYPRTLTHITMDLTLNRVQEFS